MNKTNKQISVSIPKRKLKIFKDRIPKSIKLEVKGVKW